MANKQHLCIDCGHAASGLFDRLAHEFENDHFSGWEVDYY